MKSPGIQHFVRPNYPMMALLIVLFLAAWGFDLYYFEPVELASFTEANFGVSELPNVLHISLIAVFTLLNAALLLKINKRFAIIRKRTYLPALFYALFILTWERSHQLIYPHFSLTLALISILLIFQTYKNRKAVQTIFWAAFFLAILSTINPIYLMLMVLLWLGMIMMQSFSFKTFMASLVALIIPWIYFYLYHLYIGAEIQVWDKLIGTFDFELITNWVSNLEKLYLLVITLIYIIALIGFYSNLFKDSIRTRHNINYLVLCLIISLGFISIYPFSMPMLMPFAAFLFAYLFAHLFTLNESLFYTILFYIVVLVNVAYWVVSVLQFDFF